MNKALVTVMVLRRFQAYSVLGYCNMYGVYLFDMLFTKLLLTQILEILMVNKLLLTRCLFDYKIFLEG